MTLPVFAISFGFLLLTIPPREGLLVGIMFMVPWMKVLLFRCFHPLRHTLYTPYLSPLIGFTIFTLDYIVRNARLQIATTYKSPCPVWCNNAFMSRLAVVITHCPDSFRNSWLPILASIPSKLSLLLYCRANDGKAVTAWKRLTETVYTLYGGILSL